MSAMKYYLLPIFYLFLFNLYAQLDNTTCYPSCSNSETLTNNGTFSVIGTFSNTGKFYNNYIFSNGGTTTNDSLFQNNSYSEVYNSGNINNRKTFINLSRFFNNVSGTFHNRYFFRNNNIIYNDGGIINYAGSKLLNAGTLNNQVGSILTNSDSLINTNTITNSSTIRNYGIIINELNITNNDSIYNYGTLTIESTGNYVGNNSNTIINEGLFENYGNFLNNSGSIRNKDSIYNGNIFNFNGIIFNPGKIQNNGNWGLSNVSGMNSSGEIINSGNFNSRGLDNNGLFDNSGTVNAKEYFTNRSQFYNSGTFTINTLCEFRNFIGAESTNTGVMNNSGTFTNMSTFDNSGTFRNNYDFVNSGPFNNNDIFINNKAVYNSNTFINYSSFTNNSQFINYSGYTFINRGSFINNMTFSNSGKFINEGTISDLGNFSGTGILENRMDLSPGNSPGSINISGNLSFVKRLNTTDAPRYIAEIGLVEHDNISVVGNVDFGNGTLELVLIEGRTISAGEQFEIMNYSSKSGEFENLILEDISPLSWNVEYGATSLIVSAELVLPVEFSDFILSKVRNSVLLEWQTSSEINSDFYDIEKSLDGQVFETIGRVYSDNLITGSSYSFVDPYPFKNNNYYRIRQTDFNGSFNYSVTRSIQYDGSFDVIISNTIENNSLNIYLFQNQPMILNLFSIDGKRVLVSKLEGGENNINIRGLVSGVYFISVNNGEKSYQRKVFIP